MPTINIMTEEELRARAEADLRTILDGNVTHFEEGRARAAFLHATEPLWEKITDLYKRMEPYLDPKKNRDGNAIARRGVLPFNGKISGGASAALTVYPQNIFKPIQLVVDDESRGFLITDIRIGTMSQFHSNDSIPSSMFTRANNILDFFDIDATQISQQITILVSNTGTEARDFNAMLYGFVAR